MLHLMIWKERVIISTELQDDLNAHDQVDVASFERKERVVICAQQPRLLRSEDRGTGRSILGLMI